MSGINKIILVGHLGKDPEFKYIQDNVAVLTFPLATSEFIIKNGVKTEQTDWHNIIMWRTLAEAGYKLLRKGKLVYVEGKARTRAFEDKEGVRRYTTEIIPDNFTILGRKSDFETDELNSSPAGSSEH